ASDRGSLPEVIGTAGVTVDADDHAAIARELRSVLLDDSRLAELRQRGLERAGQFSWDRTADGMAAVYSALLPNWRGQGQPREIPIAAD
ncbi:MAG: hypothetical protein ACRD1H_03825, partial [Vicinamibacterales bacterium]